MEHNSQQPATPEQETIFTEAEFTPGQYDKTIRQARTALFVVAAIQMIMAIYQAIVTEERMESTISFVITAGVSIVFFLLGMYSKKKPYTAIVSGLVLYGSLLLLDIIMEPASIFKGIIMKGLIIYYLARSVNDAKEAQEGMKHLNG
jgi:hypothetical protein